MHMISKLVMVSSLIMNNLGEVRFVKRKIIRGVAKMALCLQDEIIGNLEAQSDYGMLKITCV